MAEETGSGLLQLLGLIHAQLPRSHIVALALLPKGEVWPNRCSDAITTVNARLQVPSFCLLSLSRKQAPLHANTSAASMHALAAAELLFQPLCR